MKIRWKRNRWEVENGAPYPWFIDLMALALGLCVVWAVIVTVYQICTEGFPQ